MLQVLTLFDFLDHQAQLLANLIMRAAVQIRDAGLHVENGGDRIQRELARLFFVVDVDLGEIDFFVGAAFDGARPGASRRGGS